MIRRRFSTSSSSSIRCFSAMSSFSTGRLAARKSARADGVGDAVEHLGRLIGRVGRKLDDAIGLLAHRCHQRIQFRSPASARPPELRSGPCANGSVCSIPISRNRTSPCTMIDWFPSGSLKSLRIMQAVPTREQVGVRRGLRPRRFSG